MSAWTNEKHEQVRRRLDAADGALHCGWDDGLDGPMQGVVVNAYDDLADALFEIERLRALTTITDDMVGRSHAAVVDHLSANAGCVYAEDEGPDMLRAALEAALNPGEGA